MRCAKAPKADLTPCTRLTVPDWRRANLRWTRNLRVRLHRRLLRCESDLARPARPNLRRALADLPPLQTTGGVCIPRNTCQAPNVITPVGNGLTSTCTCAAGYVSNGAGGCVLATSARARMSRKQKKAVVPKHPHAARAVAAHQEVFRPLVDAVASPKTSERIKNSCPTGETACALPSGGFECLDVTSSLMSCEWLLLPFRPTEQKLTELSFPPNRRRLRRRRSTWRQLPCYVRRVLLPCLLDSCLPSFSPQQPRSPQRRVPQLRMSDRLLLQGLAVRWRQVRLIWHSEGFFSIPLELSFHDKIPPSVTHRRL